MAQSNKKVIKGTSPVGTLMWFKLVKPDQKYVKYTVDLIVDDTPEIRKVIDAMDEAIEEKFKEEVAKADEKKDFKRKKILIKANQKPIEPQLDANGKETGKFVMKFRMAAKGMKKDNSIYHVQPPALFNPKAQPYSPDEKAKLQVFNGSLGKLNFELSPYALATGAVGVTLKPKACMIYKIQQVDTDASQYGFAASEYAQDDQDSSEFESEAQAESQAASGTNEDF